LARSLTTLAALAPSALAIRADLAAEAVDANAETARSNPDIRFLLAELAGDRGRCLTDVFISKSRSGEDFFI
jgi:hypothetical protein